MNAHELRVAQSVGGSVLPLGTTAMRAIDFVGDSVEERERALVAHATRLREAVGVLVDCGVDVHDLAAVRAAAPTLPVHLRRAVRVELGSQARHRLARRPYRHPQAFERHLASLRFEAEHAEGERAIDEIDDTLARLEATELVPEGLARIARITRAHLELARADSRGDEEAGRAPRRARIESAAALHACAICDVLDLCSTEADA